MNPFDIDIRLIGIGAAVIAFPNGVGWDGFMPGCMVMQLGRKFIPGA